MGIYDIWIWCYSASFMPIGFAHDELFYFLLLVPQVQDGSSTGSQEDGETEQHILHFDGSGTWW